MSLRAWMVFVLAGASSSVATAQAASAVVDPVTRYFQVSYAVPEDAPDAVSVVCTWSPAGVGAWRPARVLPFVSETALRLAPVEAWGAWAQGHLTERGAAGLWRTVLFNPYPDAWQEGRVEADFRIEIRSGDGAPLTTHTVRVSGDLSDVVYLEDWSQVFQKDGVSGGEAAEAGQWWWPAAGRCRRIPGDGGNGRSRRDAASRPSTTGITCGRRPIS